MKQEQNCDEIVSREQEELDRYDELQHWLDETLAS